MYAVTSCQLLGLGWCGDGKEAFRGISCFRSGFSLPVSKEISTLYNGNKVDYKILSVMVSYGTPYLFV